jgi:ankyrin repeat protein
MVFFRGLSCIQHGSEGLAMLWLTKGRDVLENEDLSSALQLAAKHRGPALIKLLLDNGADVNYRAKSSIKTALHEAVHRGSIEIVQLLLDRGASPNLGYSSNHSSTSADTVRLLVERGAHVNRVEDEGWTSLHWWPGLVKFLLQHDADCNVENAREDTPLRLAARLGRLNKARELLECGVDPSLGPCCCTALE